MGTCNRTNLVGSWLLCETFPFQNHPWVTNSLLLRLGQTIQWRWNVWWRRMDSNHRAVKNRFTVCRNRPLCHISNLEHWAGFKPAVLRICNPLPWVTRPPVRIVFGTGYGNRTRLTYVKGMCPKPIDEPSKIWRSQGESNSYLRRDKPLYWPLYYGTKIIEKCLRADLCVRGFRAIASG